MKNTDEESCSSTNVKFSVVYISEHSIRMCDNPGCRDGPPIALDVAEGRRTSIPIDDYEKQRGPRRHRDELRISRLDREALLQRYGYSRDQMEELVQQLKKEKKQNSDKSLVKDMLSSARKVFFQGGNSRKQVADSEKRKGWGRSSDPLVLSKSEDANDLRRHSLHGTVESPKRSSLRLITNKSIH